MRIMSRWTFGLMAVVTVLGLGVAGSLPAAAAQTATLATAPPYYLALGDSLATGIGASAGHGYVDDFYQALKAKQPDLQLVNLSCPNETSASLIANSVCSGANSQLDRAVAFLRANRGRVAIVTIDIGANDVLTACTITASQIDGGCLGQAFNAIGGNVQQIMSQLTAAAGRGVSFIGMTYYDPFLVEWLNGQQAFAQATAQFAAQFNQKLRQAYSQFGARVADAESAFATQNFSSMVTRPYAVPPSRTVPVNVANICAWLAQAVCTPGTANTDIHANDVGARVLARAFAAVSPLPTANIATPDPLSLTRPAQKPAPRSTAQSRHAKHYAMPTWATVLMAVLTGTIIIGALVISLWSAKRWRDHRFQDRS